MRHDGKHLQIGASLRKGQLYVKAPYHKTVELVQALEAAGEDLLLKKVYWNTASKYQPFVFVGSVEDWNDDLKVLVSICESVDVTEIIKEFRFVITLGLNSDPEVDWVSRIDGPAAEASAPSIGLVQSEPEPDQDVPIDLAEFVASPSGPGGPEGE